MSNFLKPNISLLLFIRNFGKRPHNWYGEGIQYPGFKYYPRDPDFKDPPYEASKLFRVELIKKLKGRPYWEKNIILNDLKLTDKLHDYSIVKNIPEVNLRLWRVKHLIKISPITFPNGFPDDATGTFLKDNGELIVSKHLNPKEERLQAYENFKLDSKKLDGDTLRRESRQRWNLGLTPI